MKEIAIIGFGNQAKAWALNLRDSGWKICIGLRSNSPSIELAYELSFETFNYTEQAHYKTYAVLTPDDTHFDIIKTITALNSEANFIYAHGFSLQYSNILKEFSEHNHILLAPKAIASELRWQYETGGKNGGVYSFEYVHAEEFKVFTKTLGKDLGLTGLYEASVKDETIADLFSEQSLLCSVLPYSALYSYKQLRQEGISKEVAYFECWYEVKLIVDTLIKIGPAKFFELISPNALIGADIGKELIFNQDYLNKLDTLFTDIKSEKFLSLIEQIDIEALREKTNHFWQDQELTHTHSEMQSSLF